MRSILLFTISYNVRAHTMFAGCIIYCGAIYSQQIWAERGATERSRMCAVIRAEGRARVQRPEGLASV